MLIRKFSYQKYSELFNGEKQKLEQNKKKR